jgi:DNA-binding MarR family transcriptional regulator
MRARISCHDILDRKDDAPVTALSDDDYARLLGLRTNLRRFLHWSEERAAEAGLTSAQHQLLLAIRGSDTPHGPSVGEVAESLLLRPHSATELVDRAERAGLVARRLDPADQRVVRLALTARSRRVLEHLSMLHLEELRRLGATIGPVLQDGGAPGP